MPIVRCSMEREVLEFSVIVVEIVGFCEKDKLGASNALLDYRKKLLITLLKNELFRIFNIILSL